MLKRELDFYRFALLERRDRGRRGDPRKPSAVTGIANGTQGWILKQYGPLQLSHLG